MLHHHSASHHYTCGFHTWRLHHSLFCLFFLSSCCSVKPSLCFSLHFSCCPQCTLWEPQATAAVLQVPFYLQFHLLLHLSEPLSVSLNLSLYSSPHWWVFVVVIPHPELVWISWILVFKANRSLEFGLGPWFWPNLWLVMFNQHSIGDVGALGLTMHQTHNLTWFTEPSVIHLLDHLMIQHFPISSSCVLFYTKIF